VTWRSGPVWLWAATLAAALLVAGLRHLPTDPPLGALENRLVDLRFRIRGPRPAPKTVLIVAIDDASLEAIGLMTPLREALATAVRRIGAAGAASIVIDLLLIEPTPADARLAQALSASPATILAVAAVPGEPAPVAPEVRSALRRSAFPVVLGFGPPAFDPVRLVVPAPELAAAAARLGHVNVALSPDRIARRAPLSIPLADGAALPSAALLAAARALGGAPEALRLERGSSVQLGRLRVATDKGGQVLLNHFGGPGAIETVSLNALLAGRIGPERIEGRTVFIGARADTLGDIFATPFAPAVAGVEILGTLAANLIGGDLMRTGAAAWMRTTFLTLAFVALAGFAASVPASPFVAVGATVCTWLLALAALQLAFEGRYALDVTTAIGGILFASAAHWLWRLKFDQRRRRDLEADRTRLSSYMSPFAATVLPRGEQAPAWRTEAATIGFVDVVGSVGLAEARSPEDTAAYLSRIQGHIAGAADRHGGAGVERAGDGALVVFGFGGAGGAREALDFARDVTRGAPEGVEVRVSLQHGPVALADLGGGAWGHVALAGDTVNVAARLQDAARRAGSAIVVGRAVLDAAGVDPASAPGDLLSLPPETVRGRRGSVEVWAVVA
jgi:adenylate cyclase